jgi:hypothetical protein
MSDREYTLQGLLDRVQDCSLLRTWTEGRPTGPRTRSIQALRDTGDTVGQWPIGQFNLREGTHEKTATDSVLVIPHARVNIRHV